MNFFRFLSPLLLALKDSFSSNSRIDCSNSRISTLTKLDYLSFFSLFLGGGGRGGEEAGKGGVERAKIAATKRP